MHKCIIVMITVIYWVNSQLYIKLETSTNIQFKLDNLSLACLPVNEATEASISDIILWKYSGFGWERLIKVFGDISQGEVMQRIVWFNNNVANRSIVALATVAPSSIAGLIVVISADNMKYSDTGTYRCSINGNFQHTSAKLHDFSVPKSVRIIGDHENTSSGARPTGFKLGNLVLFLAVGSVGFVISISIPLACCLCSKQHKELDTISMENDSNNQQQCSYVIPNETYFYENVKSYTELQDERSTTVSIDSNKYEPFEELNVYGNSCLADDSVDEQIYMNV